MPWTALFNLVPPNIFMRNLSEYIYLNNAVFFILLFKKVLSIIKKNERLFTFPSFFIIWSLLHYKVNTELIIALWNYFNEIYISGALKKIFSSDIIFYLKFIDSNPKINLLHFFFLCERNKYSVDLNELWCFQVHVRFLIE